MPIPVSTILNLMILVLIEIALIVILPFFVNFNEFPTKFMIICLNLLGSLYIKFGIWGSQWDKSYMPLCSAWKFIKVVIYYINSFKLKLSILSENLPALT